jgi:putative chitobiose transport system substrate-binding protein
MGRWRRRSFLQSFLQWAGGTALGLAACGRSNSSQAVQFWTMQLQPKFTNYFQQVIAEFSASRSGRAVQWLDVPWAAMESKILTAVAARTAPDVVNLNPSFASRLAARGAWLALDRLVPPAVQGRYLPKIWQANAIDGRSFGVPWYLTTKVTIYNRSLLDRAGIDRPPATYEALAETARLIREKTGKYGFFLTVAPNDSAELLESLVQMGVQLVDDRGRAAFESAAGRAAATYWVNLFQRGWLPKEVLTQGHRRGIELYQAGESAIVGSSPEFLNAIATNAPTIAAVSAAAPQITGPSGDRGVAVMNLTIPKKTPRPEAALDFALFLTDDRHQLSFAKAANVLPSTQGALRSLMQSFQKQAASSTLDRARQIAAEQLSTARVLLPPIKNIKDLQQILYENLQGAMLDEKTVDQALKDAAAEWNGLTTT